MASAAQVGLSYAGMVTSIIQNMSGFPLVRRILKEKDARPYPKFPLFSMTGCTMLYGLYSVFVIKQVDGFLFCNWIGFFFWCINAAVMTYYTPGKGRWVLGGSWVLLVLACLFYVLGLFPWGGAPPGSADALAAVTTVFNVSGFASPMTSLYGALRTLDMRRVPLMLSWLNVANSSLWIGYGVLLNDAWVWGPNVAGVVLGSTQLMAAAWIRYRLWRGDKPILDDVPDSADGAGAAAAKAAAASSPSGESESAQLVAVAVESQLQPAEQPAPEDAGAAIAARYSREGYRAMTPFHQQRTLAAQAAAGDGVRLPEFDDLSLGMVVLWQQEQQQAPAEQLRVLIIEQLSAAGEKYAALPKGHPEAGEDDATAALRELREETGLALTAEQLVPGVWEAQRYTYYDAERQGGASRKGVVHKVVRYGLALLRPTEGSTAPPAVTPQPGEVASVAWLPLHEALGALGPDTADVVRALVKRVPVA